MAQVRLGVLVASVLSGLLAWLVLTSAARSIGATDRVSAK
jgi:hypothetical protein